MSMSRSFRCSAIGTLLLATATSLVSAEPGALWLEPSKQWYGIDGNWSAVGLYAGVPKQKVDVFVSTALSEIWTVEKAGCSLNDTICKTGRGGVYDTSTSDDRQPLGAWRLGLEYLGLEGNGDYAFETVSVFDDNQKQETSLTQQLVAGINDTDFYLGYFGLGVNNVRFQDVVADGPITVLAGKTVIGSRSYGYSAGAYYAGASGTPLSLTLGGYDVNRFVPHDTLFSLNATTQQPEVTITHITASISDDEKKPASWPAASVGLIPDDGSTTALIDSSTPYLWLPSSTCDKFAVAFNLTWNSTFGLYLFSDESLEAFRTLPDLSVAFTLAGTDDSEESTDEQVTLTLSANAFIQYLRSPFMGLSSGTAAIPYFPLRRVDDGGKVIIGRTFLQETYLVTNYETNVFSVHQAKFPDNPFTDTSIKAIAPGDYAGPVPPDDAEGGSGLSKEQLAGIVVGASVASVAIAMLVWWLLRRRKEPGPRAETASTLKYSDSFAPPTSPTSPKAESGGFFSRISKSLPWLKSTRGAYTPSPAYGAGPSREGYWTPSPMPELDAKRVRSMNGGAEFRPGSRGDMAAYEIARMGLDPLPLEPEYDPLPSSTQEQFHMQEQFHTQEQFHGQQDIHLTVNPRRSSTDLGLYNLFPGSPTPDTFSDGSTSPMSPYGDTRYDWTSQHTMNHYPSSQPLVHSQLGTFRSNSTLSSGSAEPQSALRSVSSHGSLAPPSPPPPVQRGPIDGANVICLGPLPDNIKLPPLPFPSSSSMAPPPPPPPPAHHSPYGDFFEPPPIPPSVNYRRNRVSTAETLGSNYTVEEEARGRIDGPDIVHIPHLPERRYSWEA